ncbi:hypothetical protein [Paraburkholderia sediminicola]|uniref:hypothetical protein n=1 Tax=Paraburkholderia sediminicola TaxID=458836 RepID=UPI0038BB4AF7
MRENKKSADRLPEGASIGGLLGGLGDIESHEAATVTAVRMNPSEFSTHDAEIEGLVVQLDTEEFGVDAEVEHV